MTLPNTTGHQRILQICSFKGEVLCPTLCNPMDCSLPVSSVYGIFQARILEWVAISFSRGSSQPRDRTLVSCNAGRRFTIWATREAQVRGKVPQNHSQGPDIPWLTHSLEKSHYHLWLLTQKPETQEPFPDLAKVGRAKHPGPLGNNLLGSNRLSKSHGAYNGFNCVSKVLSLELTRGYMGISCIFPHPLFQNVLNIVEYIKKIKLH